MNIAQLSSITDVQQLHEIVTTQLALIAQRVVLLAQHVQTIIYRKPTSRS